MTRLSRSEISVYILLYVYNTRCSKGVGGTGWSSSAAVYLALKVQPSSNVVGAPVGNSEGNSEPCGDFQIRKGPHSGTVMRNNGEISEKFSVLDFLLNYTLFCFMNLSWWIWSLHYQSTADYRVFLPFPTDVWVFLKLCAPVSSQEVAEMRLKSRW